MRPCIGIDNGITGAIARINGVDAQVFPFRTWKDGKDTCIDERWLHELLNLVHNPLVLVEKAQKFSPGKLALCSTWNSWATIRTVLRLLNLEYAAVPPQRWQSVMLREYPRRTPDDTKGASVLAARALFPNVSLRRSARCTTDDHNMSDALLMAEYIRRISI